MQPFHRLPLPTGHSRQTWPIPQIVHLKYNYFEFPFSPRIASVTTHIVILEFCRRTSEFSNTSEMPIVTLASFCHSRISRPSQAASEMNAGVSEIVMHLSLPHIVLEQQSCSGLGLGESQT